MDVFFNMAVSVGLARQAVCGTKGFTEGKESQC